MTYNFNNYNLVSQKKLDELCDYSSELIFNSLEKISIIALLYSKCTIRTTPPFATNFRDALFHYKKLYESDTIEEAISQSEAIEEHLSRALKDCMLQLAQILLHSINAIYTSPDIEDTIKIKLQKVIHDLKQAILKLRINSMDIVRLSEDEFGIMDEVSNCIVLCCSNNEIKSLLLDYCSRYVRKIKVHFLNELKDT